MHALLPLTLAQVQWSFDKPLSEHSKWTPASETSAKQRCEKRRRTRRDGSSSNRPAEIPRPFKMDIFPKQASPAMSGFILNLVGPDLLAHPETKLKVLVNPDAVRAFSASKTVHGIVVPSVAHGFPCDRLLQRVSCVRSSAGSCCLWQPDHWPCGLHKEKLERHFATGPIAWRGHYERTDD